MRPEKGMRRRGVKQPVKATAEGSATSPVSGLPPS